MSLDLSKLTPAPWFAAQWGDAWAVFYIDYRGIVAKGMTEANARSVALTRNAFDVMMRRGWTSHRGDPEGCHPDEWNVVDRDGRIIWRGDDIAWHTDPFTALVEADKWLAEREKANA